MPKKKLTQALPSVRRRANLNQHANQEWTQRITDLAIEAYRGPSPEDEFTKLFSVNKAPVIAQQLAEEYISVKYYKVPLKEFRGTTTNLGRSLRKLLESIPPDTQPPIPQMKKNSVSKERQWKMGPTRRRICGMKHIARPLLRVRCAAGSSWWTN